MIKIIFITIAFFTFTFLLNSCDKKTNNSTIENKSMSDNGHKQIENSEIDSVITNDFKTGNQKEVNLRASEFVKNLKSGESLRSFFNDNWIFIYHEDNRCDGSTDGQIFNLQSALIDSTIALEVKNDGDGWGCDKKEPTTYTLEFELKKKTSSWNRFEIPNYENNEKDIVYIVGAGESDYLKLYYNDNNLVVKLEYRSEDPG